MRKDVSAWKEVVHAIQAEKKAFIEELTAVAEEARRVQQVQWVCRDTRLTLTCAKTCATPSAELHGFVPAVEKDR